MLIWYCSRELMEESWTDIYPSISVEINKAHQSKNNYNQNIYLYQIQLLPK